MSFLKNILLAAVVAAGVVPAVAQGERCPLPVMVKVLEGECDLAGANEELLGNKLEQIVSAEGFGGSDMSHLCLTASVSETGKEVLGGTRPSVATTVDVYLVLTNLLTGEKFGSASVSLSGAGRNEAQAFRRALSQINTNNPGFQTFLRKARGKVFDYYDANMKSIAKQAVVLSNRGEYEKALYLLSSVPPCCPDYEAVGDAMLQVWQTYLDQDCAEKLSKAMAVWHSSQTEEAAKVAAAYLAGIDHKSACKDSAQALLDEISAKIGENIARQIEREDEDREFEKEQVRAAIDLKRAEIDAIRELALAYAQFVLGPAVANLTQPQPAPNVTIL